MLDEQQIVTTNRTLFVVDLELVDVMPRRAANASAYDDVVLRGSDESFAIERRDRDQTTTTTSTTDASSTTPRRTTHTNDTLRREISSSFDEANEPMINLVQTNSRESGDVNIIDKPTTTSTSTIELPVNNIAVLSTSPKSPTTAVTTSTTVSSITSQKSPPTTKQSMYFGEPYSERVERV